MIATAGFAPASPGMLQGILSFKLRCWWQRTESNGCRSRERRVLYPLSYAAPFYYTFSMPNFDIKLNINCKLYISLVAESRSPPDSCLLLPLLRGGQELSFVPLIKGDARRIET